MALITCPECGKSVSDKAANCPNCGCPIAVAPGADPHSREDLNAATTKKNKKTTKTIVIIVSVIILLGGLLTAGYFLFLSPNAKNARAYKAATSAYEAGEYQEALSILSNLNTEESIELAKKCNYNLGVECIEQCDWNAALSYLSNLHYEDSDSLVETCKYQLGIEAMEAHNWADAEQYFAEIDYEHSQEMLTDCQFMQDLEASVLRRMEINSKESSDLSTITNTELAYLEKYSTASFYDPRLKQLKREYISGLKLQKRALTQVYPWDYQKDWNTGLVRRIEVLNTLYREYDFLANNNDFVGEYINQYDYWKKWLDAFNALEDMFSKAYAREENYRQDNKYFYFTFTNTTEYTFTNQMDFWIYDYEGVNLLDTASVVTKDIRPGDTVTIKLYVGNYDTWWLKEYGNWYPEIKIS